MKTAILIPDITYAHRSPIAEAVAKIASSHQELELLLLFPEGIDKPGLPPNFVIETYKATENSFFKSIYWKKLGLKKVLKKHNCDKIYVQHPQHFNTGNAVKISLGLHIQFGQLISGKADTIPFSFPFYFPEVTRKVILPEQFYFLTYIHPANKHLLLPVLKAFSAFKRRMKSGLQLQVCLDGISSENIIPHFDLYKYRDDVRFLEADGTLLQSYYQTCLAFVYPATENDTYYPALHALQSGAVTIMHHTKMTTQIFGESVACYTGETSLGNLLQDIYKNEPLQADYKAKAKTYSLMLQTMLDSVKINA